MLELNNAAFFSMGALLGSACLTGGWGKSWGKKITQSVSISAVSLACVCSVWILIKLSATPEPTRIPLYTWGFEGQGFTVAFMLDRLSALMMAMVTFVSLMVQLYSVGYMKEEKDQSRFFSYLTLFTFSMLMLVLSNNFLQLFFGWEMVGVLSYLLIGFWFEKEKAVQANFKAFILNRVGDFGFIIGIAAIFYGFGTLDFESLHQALQNPSFKMPLIQLGGIFIPLIPFACSGLLMGVMAKSAQIPLQGWLPDSMEGPTPVSALIHAATMVTAGVFMLARLSFLFEEAESILSFLLIIGSATSVLMGLVAMVQKDIKRIIAYSTLSQLGYMMLAMGVSAYSAGIFHLITHAFFKSLLFLGAGSVIMAAHHEQDIFKIKNSRKTMPITYGALLVGSLALMGFPFLSGFYSKEAILEALHLSHRKGAALAYWAGLFGVFTTAFYSFRLFFVVFHAPIVKQEREVLKESPRMMQWPLGLLTFASVIMGGLLMAPFLKGYLNGGGEFKTFTDLLNFQAVSKIGLEGFLKLPFCLGMMGILAAWIGYVQYPSTSECLKKTLLPFHRLLSAQLGFDGLYSSLARWALYLGKITWQWGDVKIIDGLGVQGGARLILRLSSKIRQLQSGYLYYQVFTLVIGFILLVTCLFLAHWIQG